MTVLDAFALSRGLPSIWRHPKREAGTFDHGAYQLALRTWQAARGDQQ